MKIRESEENWQRKDEHNLGTPQAKLFIGQKSSGRIPWLPHNSDEGIFLHNDCKCKKTRKVEAKGCQARGLGRVPPTSLGHIPLQRAKHSSKKEKNRQRRQANGDPGEICMCMGIHKHKKTQACKQGGKAKAKKVIKEPTKLPTLTCLCLS